MAEGDGVGTVIVAVSRRDGRLERLVARADGIWLEIEGVGADPTDPSVETPVWGPWPRIEDALDAVGALLDLDDGDRVETCALGSELLHRYVRGYVEIDGTAWCGNGDLGAIPSPGARWAIESASNRDDYDHPGGEWSSTLCCIDDVYWIEDEYGSFVQAGRFDDHDDAVRWWLDTIPEDFVGIDDLVEGLEADSDLVDDAYGFVRWHCSVDPVTEIDGKPVYLAAAIERWFVGGGADTIAAELDALRRERDGLDDEDDDDEDDDA